MITGPEIKRQSMKSKNLFVKQDIYLPRVKSQLTLYCLSKKKKKFTTDIFVKQPEIINNSKRDLVT